MMKIKIIYTKKFNKTIKALIRSKALLLKDFEILEKHLAESPKAGDLIIGTGGIRKIRIKSAFEGKSGGFRICYFYSIRYEEVYLILIYPKNKQENISTEEKKMLKELTSIIKTR